jgi:acyl carrier protein
MTGAKGFFDAGRVQTIRECLRKVLALSDAEAAAVGPDSTPVQLPRWTSLAHVLLVLELERAFDVTFEAEEIAALASVGSILSALERRGL